LKRRERSGELTETSRQWAEVCFVPGVDYNTLSSIL
jgi:hypothetical protein